MTEFADFFAGLDSDPNRRGLQFEKATKWWLENDALWGSTLEKVWRWSDWPGRNARDIGIDLVAKDHSGRLYAIQCKAYDPDANLKKSDIDSFLSASSKRVFHSRLLVTTTKFIGTNARSALEGQEKPVQVVDWNRLSTSQLDWTHAIGKRTRSVATEKKLLPHQEKALKAVTKQFGLSDRGQLIMACGSGKTLTSLRIQEALDVELTVVLVPSLTLLSQTLDDWLRDRKVKFNWLAICSDESVANDPQDNSHLIDYDFPVTTKIHEISQFLREDGKKVIFSTYQSSTQLAQAVKTSKVTVDLVIADEAHRLAGKTQSDFASMIVDESIPIRRRLFLTATPRVYTSAAIAKAAELGVQTLSMDDKSIFGPVFYRFDFPQAITENVLCDYRVVVIGVEEDDLTEAIESRSLVRAGLLDTDLESLAIHVAVSKAMKKWRLRRMISFHSRVSKARTFAKNQEIVEEWLPKKLKSGFKLSCETVSSGMPTSYRRQALEKLKQVANDEAVIVSNARCLTEGIDVPTLDGVIFVDPRSSQVDIIQAVGRAIRRGGSDKTHGTILLPVVLPQSEELLDAKLKTSAYAAIWGVLNALRAHDASFGEEIDQMRQALGKRDSVGEKPSKLVWDLPAKVDREIARKIQAVAIRNASEFWEEAYSTLVEFKAANGHASPQQNFITDKGLKLGIWLGAQRSLKNKGLLEPEKVERLDHLGVYWNILDAAWEQGFSLAELHYKKHKSLVVGQNYTVKVPHNIATGDSLFRLGQWLAVQAQSYRDGKLSKDRIQKLEAIGIVWNRLEDRWSAELEELDSFLAHEKRWPDRKDDKTQSGFAIGYWFGNQIVRYRNGTLDPKKAKDLEDRGAPLEKKEEIRWQLIFDDLVDFHREFGHARPTKPHVGKSGYELYGWCAIQREAQASGRLSASRKAKLDSLGFYWLTGDIQVDNRKIAVWFERFEDAKQFRNTNGHCLIPHNYVTDSGEKLGGWANIQRFRYRNGKLEAERVELLNSIGFVWEPQEQAWFAAFERYEAYFSRTGTTKIPQTYRDADGYLLGAWVAKQTRLLRENKLDKKQKIALEKLLSRKTKQTKS